MKYSDAMLSGFTKVGGRQCTGRLGRISDDGKLIAVCVNGAANLGATGNPYSWPDSFRDAQDVFEAEWGFRPAALNNGEYTGMEEPMAWEEIYGMAVAAGL